MGSGKPEELLARGSFEASSEAGRRRGRLCQACSRGYLEANWARTRTTHLSSLSASVHSFASFLGRGIRLLRAVHSSAEDEKGNLKDGYTLNLGGMWQACGFGGIRLDPASQRGSCGCGKEGLIPRSCSSRRLPRSWDRLEIPFEFEAEVCGRLLRHRVIVTHEGRRTSGQAEVGDY